MNVGDLCSVFVYGTLQRGECRDSCWPFPPGRVERARIRAQLFDLGEYPAIVLGDDWVLGECWQFAPAEMARTLSILDDIEGYSGSPDDLYCRQVVEFERLDAEAEQEPKRQMASRTPALRHVTAKSSAMGKPWRQRGM